MTVNASVMWRERYKGDGMQSQWPVPFPFLQPEHVRATLVDPAGAGRSLLYNAEYTVSVNTERRGGTVGYLVPANHELVVHLDLPYSQEIDLYNNGIMDAEVLEYGLDKLTLLCAQLAERISRAVMVDIASTDTPEALCTALIQARDTAVSSAGEAASLFDAVQVHAATAQHSATVAQTEADRAMGYVDKVEADVSGLEQHLVTVGDAQVARVSKESGVQVARAKAEADRAAAVVPGFTSEDKGKSLVLGAQGPEWGNIEAIPPGLISLWSGAINAIPVGWALCNGENGTPDLRDRFVLGAGGEYPAGQSGGAKTHEHAVTVGATTLTVAQMPSHTHGNVMLATQYYPNRGGSGSNFTTGSTAAEGGNGSHTHTATASGGDLPPWYALAYIMKL